MKSSFISTVLLAGLPSIFSLPSPPICRDVTFSPSVEAENVLAQNPPVDFTNATEVVAFLTQKTKLNPVSGTYKIYTQLCLPTVPISGSPKPLQILVPGNGYDHLYYNGLDATPLPGNINSWAAFALSKGYPTLSLDRLGSGRSDHPDPLNTVQAPLVAETIHEVIRQIRGGEQTALSALGKLKIVFVGHSYGAILGTRISADHPDDVDAIIHTGFAIPTANQNALPGELADVYLQASTYDPARFPPSVFVPGFLIATSKEGRRSTFYSAPEDFSAALYDKDFKLKDTLALGEAITQQPLISNTYDKPTFVLTGRQDAVFCGNGSRELGIPDCGSGPTSQLAAVKLLYPAVPEGKFDTFTQEHAGHCNQIHFSAQEGFKRAHDFLAAQGL
ncbi:MAG: hypothetical protein L6R39_002209 [Caloplaca ligustica]|nr:MAG: hypothetical protein L6R39_002209 [Caloplaca ligustica]